MKTKKLWVMLATAAAAIGIAGCNLFNPTESVDVASDDANALTYEGYIKFRDNEYTEAAKYFNKAIAADSAHSEAWFGLAKAKLNMQNLNTFELLKYVNNGSSTTTVPLVNMDDATAERYKAGIDTVITYMKEFIYRDTTGKLDGKVTYASISDSYMLLEMLQAFLSVRKVSTNMPDCLSGTSENCDLGTLLNGIKEDGEETVEAMHEVFQTCADNPASMSTLADQYIQGFDWISDDKQSDAVGAFCSALAETTEDTGDEEGTNMALDAIISSFGYGEMKDDDGDGCIDEELYDGADNDGDGIIDEDIRDKTNNIEYDYNQSAMNAAMGKNALTDLLIITSARPNEKYKTLDIDHNGEAGEDNEWDFIHSSYKDRVANNDHRMKFAKDLVYNPQGLSPEEFKAYKSMVASDSLGTYDLEFRKTFIGGCWVNYTEADFQALFNGGK